jgi:hypothetical protein
MTASPYAARTLTTTEFQGGLAAVLLTCVVGAATMAPGCSAQIWKLQYTQVSLTAAPLAMPAMCRYQQGYSLPACLVGAAAWWWRQHALIVWTCRLRQQVAAPTPAPHCARWFVVKAPTTHLYHKILPSYEAHSLTMPWHLAVASLDCTVVGFHLAKKRTP